MKIDIDKKLTSNVSWQNVSIRTRKEQFCWNI